MMPHNDTGFNFKDLEDMTSGSSKNCCFFDHSFLWPIPPSRGNLCEYQHRNGYKTH